MRLFWPATDFRRHDEERTAVRRVLADVQANLLHAPQWTELVHESVTALQQRTRSRLPVSPLCQAKSLTRSRRHTPVATRWRDSVWVRWIDTVATGGSRGPANGADRPGRVCRGRARRTGGRDRRPGPAGPAAPSTTSGPRTHAGCMMYNKLHCCLLLLRYVAACACDQSRHCLCSRAGPTAPARACTW